MALSIATRGKIGPKEDAIDMATRGYFWRNRAIQEIIEEISLMGLDFILNASMYPEVNDRALMQLIIEKMGDIYTILDIIARGGFVEAAADLF